VLGGAHPQMLSRLLQSIQRLSWRQQ